MASSSRTNRDQQQLYSADQDATMYCTSSCAEMSSALEEDEPVTAPVEATTSRATYEENCYRPHPTQTRPLTESDSFRDTTRVCEDNNKSSVSGTSRGNGNAGSHTTLGASSMMSNDDNYCRNVHQAQQQRVLYAASPSAVSAATGTSLSGGVSRQEQVYPGAGVARTVELPNGDGAQQKATAGGFLGGEQPEGEGRRRAGSQFSWVAASSSAAYSGSGFHGGGGTLSELSPPSEVSPPSSVSSSSTTTTAGFSGGGVTTDTGQAPPSYGTATRELNECQLDARLLEQASLIHTHEQKNMQQQHYHQKTIQNTMEQQQQQQRGTFFSSAAASYVSSTQRQRHQEQTNLPAATLVLQQANNNNNNDSASHTQQRDSSFAPQLSGANGDHFVHLNEMTAAAAAGMRAGAGWTTPPTAGQNRSLPQTQRTKSERINLEQQQQQADNNRTTSARTFNSVATPAPTSTPTAAGTGPLLLQVERQHGNELLELELQRRKSEAKPAAAAAINHVISANASMAPTSFNAPRPANSFAPSAFRFFQPTQAAAAAQEVASSSSAAAAFTVNGPTANQYYCLRSLQQSQRDKRSVSPAPDRLALNAPAAIVACPPPGAEFALACRQRPNTITNNNRHIEQQTQATCETSKTTSTNIPTTTTMTTNLSQRIPANKSQQQQHRKRRRHRSTSGQRSLSPDSVSTTTTTNTNANTSALHGERLTRELSALNVHSSIWNSHSHSTLVPSSAASNGCLPAQNKAISAHCWLVDSSEEDREQQNKGEKRERRAGQEEEQKQVRANAAAASSSTLPHARYLVQKPSPSSFDAHTLAATAAAAANSATHHPYPTAHYSLKRNCQQQQQQQQPLTVAIMRQQQQKQQQQCRVLDRNTKNSSLPINANQLSDELKSNSVNLQKCLDAHKFNVAAANHQQQTDNDNNSYQTQSDEEEEPTTSNSRRRKVGIHSTTLKTKTKHQNQRSTISSNLRRSHSSMIARPARTTPNCSLDSTTANSAARCSSNAVAGASVVQLSALLSFVSGLLIPQRRGRRSKSATLAHAHSSSKCLKNSNSTNDYIPPPSHSINPQFVHLTTTQLNWQPPPPPSTISSGARANYTFMGGSSSTSTSAYATGSGLSTVSAQSGHHPTMTRPFHWHIGGSDSGRNVDAQTLNGGTQPILMSQFVTNSQAAGPSLARSSSVAPSSGGSSLFYSSSCGGGGGKHLTTTPASCRSTTTHAYEYCQDQDLDQLAIIEAAGVGRNGPTGICHSFSHPVAISETQFIANERNKHHQSNNKIEMNNNNNAASSSSAISSLERAHPTAERCAPPASNMSSSSSSETSSRLRAPSGSGNTTTTDNTLSRLNVGGCCNSSSRALMSDNELIPTVAGGCNGVSVVGGGGLSINNVVHVAPSAARRRWWWNSLKCRLLRRPLTLARCSSSFQTDDDDDFECQASGGLRGAELSTTANTPRGLVAGAAGDQVGVAAARYKSLRNPVRRTKCGRRRSNKKRHNSMVGGDKRKSNSTCGTLENIISLAKADRVFRCRLIGSIVVSLILLALMCLLIALIYSRAHSSANSQRTRMLNLLMDETEQDLSWLWNTQQQQQTHFSYLSSLSTTANKPPLGSGAAYAHQQWTGAAAGAGGGSRTTKSSSFNQTTTHETTINNHQQQQLLMEQLDNWSKANLILIERSERLYQWQQTMSHLNNIQLANDHFIDLTQLAAKFSLTNAAAAAVNETAKTASFSAATTTKPLTEVEQDLAALTLLSNLHWPLVKWRHQSQQSAASGFLSFASSVVGSSFFSSSSSSSSHSAGAANTQGVRSLLSFLMLADTIQEERYQQQSTFSRSSSNNNIKLTEFVQLSNLLRSSSRHLIECAQFLTLNSFEQVDSSPTRPLVFDESGGGREWFLIRLRKRFCIKLNARYKRMMLTLGLLKQTQFAKLHAEFDNSKSIELETATTQHNQDLDATQQLNQAQSSTQASSGGHMHHHGKSASHHKTLLGFLFDRLAMLDVSLIAESTLLVGGDASFDPDSYYNDEQQQVSSSRVTAAANEQELEQEHFETNQQSEQEAREKFDRELELLLDETNDESATRGDLVEWLLSPNRETSQEQQQQQDNNKWSVMELAKSCVGDGPASLNLKLEESKARAKVLENQLGQLEFERSLEWRHLVARNLIFAWPSAQLPNALQPHNYDLFLHPNLTTRLILGMVNIEIQVERPTRFIILHSAHLNLAKLSLHLKSQPAAQAAAATVTGSNTDQQQQQQQQTMNQDESSGGGLNTQLKQVPIRRAFLDAHLEQLFIELEEPMQPMNYFQPATKDSHNHHPTNFTTTQNGQQQTQINLGEFDQLLASAAADSSTKQQQQRNIYLLSVSFNKTSLQMDSTGSALPTDGTTSDSDNGIHFLNYADFFSTSSSLPSMASSSSAQEGGTNGDDLKTLLYTQFEPNFARHLFPAFDEPKFKAKFQLNLVHEQQHQVLFNAPKRERISYTSDGSLQMSVFEQTSICLSSYLVSILVSDAQNIKSITSRAPLLQQQHLNSRQKQQQQQLTTMRTTKHIQVQILAQFEHLSQAEFASQLVPQLLAFFQSHLQLPFPNDKLDLVALPTPVSSSVGHSSSETTFKWSSSTNTRATQQTKPTIASSDSSSSSSILGPDASIVAATPTARLTQMGVSTIDGSSSKSRQMVLDTTQNLGLMWFKGPLLLADANLINQNLIEQIALLISHQLAHQYFGNVISLFRWRDLWLYESLCQYLESLALTNVQSEWRLEEQFPVATIQEALALDHFPFGAESSNQYSATDELKGNTPTTRSSPESGSVETTSQQQQHSQLESPPATASANYKEQQGHDRSIDSIGRQMAFTTGNNFAGAQASSDSGVQLKRKSGILHMFLFTLLPSTESRARLLRACLQAKLYRTMSEAQFWRLFGQQLAQENLSDRLRLDLASFPSSLGSDNFLHWAALQTTKQSNTEQEVEELEAQPLLSGSSSELELQPLNNFSLPSTPKLAKSHNLTDNINNERVVFVITHQSNHQPKTTTSQQQQQQQQQPKQANHHRQTIPVSLLRPSRRFLDDHQSSSGADADKTRAQVVSSVVDSLELVSDFWSNQAGFPLISVTVERDRIILHQEQFSAFPQTPLSNQAESSWTSGSNDQNHHQRVRRTPTSIGDIADQQLSEQVSGLNSAAEQHVLAPPPPIWPIPLMFLSRFNPKIPRFIWFDREELEIPLNELLVTPTTHLNEQGTFANGGSPSSSPFSMLNHQSSSAAGSWFKLNHNQSTLARVNYDQRNWETLSDLLMKSHYSNHILNPLDRANLIDDSLTLMRCGRLSVGVAMNLTLYLEVGERDYQPWISALRHLDEMQTLLNQNPLWHRYVLKLLQPISSVIGWKDDGPHMMRKMRRRLFSVALQYRDEKIVNKAKQEFKSWLKTGRFIVPNLQELVYVAGVRYGEQLEWFHCWQKYQQLVVSFSDNNSNNNKWTNLSSSASSSTRLFDTTQPASAGPLLVAGSVFSSSGPGLGAVDHSEPPGNVENEKRQLLTALASTENTWLLEQFLNYSLDATKIQTHHLKHVMQTLSKNPVARLLLWRFVRLHWNTLLDRYLIAHTSASSEANYHGLIETMIIESTKHFASKLDYDELKNFFEAKRKMLPDNIGKAIQHSLQVVQSNIYWRDFIEPKVTKWLSHSNELINV